MSPTDLIPPLYREGASRIASALGEVNNILVAGHADPDGDAIGAAAAAGHISRFLGKKFMLYSRTGLPRSLAFLSLPGVVYSSLEHSPFSPCGAVLLDCNEAHRLDQELTHYLPKLVTINVDHHPGKGMGTSANWIFPQAAATSQLVAYVALHLGIPLSGALADAVAVGLITDTGGFRHNNTDADVLRLTAHLVETGCNISLLRDFLENDWSLERLRLWATLMSRVRLERDNTVAFCFAMADDLRKNHCLKEDLEGFVEHLRRLRGVRVAALLLETSQGTCKFSLRSAETSNAFAMASALGGGGHINAAGGTLRLAPEQAENVLLAAICGQLDEEKIS
ncbi:MAG: DHH family phosphoesterase [Desulfovibrio sp.]|jgi:phosphoesterase RecJ-like protein|nr:DHH family phosphoesterase [Desulfovibrio sp.]